MRTINPITTRYHMKKVDGKNIALHRFIMEEHLGRKLEPEEWVHHKNGIKTDNAISNLEVMNPVDHGRFHHLRHAIDKICVVCGSKFTPHKTKRKRQQTCSPDCKLVLIGRKKIKVTEAQYHEIRARRSNGEKLSVLASEFGLTQTTVSEYCRNGCLCFLPAPNSPSEPC